VMEGLMWRAMNADGTLAYTFVESVKAKPPYYIIRTIGGFLYMSGFALMLWNTVKTARNGKPAAVATPNALAHA